MDNKLTDHHRRVLCELIGEEWTNEDPFKDWVNVFAENRSFLTGNDMMLVKDAIVENGKLNDLYAFSFEKFREDKEQRYYSEERDGLGVFFTWLYTPERFFYLAAEWKGGKG